MITGWVPRELGSWWLPMRIAGGALAAAGALALVHSFVRFVTEGHGTPVPIAPPKRLVVGGLYRYVRNPMYVAVEAVIVGQALLLARLDLAVYAAFVAFIVTAFVMVYEEPELSRRFGAEYAEYRRGVGRWVPRLRPWQRGGTP